MPIARTHRTAPGVVYPAVTYTGYSPPAPGLCGANIATGDGSCSLPNAIIGEKIAAATLPPRPAVSARPIGFPHPHDPLGRLPAHTCTHRHLRAGAEELREPERVRGAVRCGAEGCRTVRGSATRFVVVTGGPVSQPARWEPTENDRFATRNATAQARYRAYRRQPVLGTVPSRGRRLVADCGDLNKNF